MSDNKPLIPVTDDGKNGYYNRVVPYINLPANQLRFKSPADILLLLNNNYAQWGPNWIKLNDATQCTEVVIELKNSLEVNLDTELDEIYGDIAKSVFTDADKAVFSIYERKAASPAVVSSIAPGNSLDTTGHLWAKILFINTATPNSKEHPRGNFVFFETYVGAAGIADADLVFTDGNVTSGASHTFHFDENQVGKTCYMHCFYQIKKGDRSPASKIISFVIN